MVAHRSEVFHFADDFNRYLEIDREISRDFRKCVSHLSRVQCANRIICIREMAFAEHFEGEAPIGTKGLCLTRHSPFRDRPEIKRERTRCRNGRCSERAVDG